MNQIFTLILFLVLFSTLSITNGAAFNNDSKVYIAYMGALPENEYSPSAHHESLLEQVLENSLPSVSLIRSYGKSFNGFAARLTDRERQKLAGIQGIVSVFPSKNIQLQTTRSWDFIGFPENVERIPNVESNIIVGFIDSGIIPSSESFNDIGFGPPPNKWKGACKGGQNFTCNNKIIGARFYTSQGLGDSAIDIVGHGTHTASTAAGNTVKGVSFYGLGTGNARGAVPSARIAVYKPCWKDGCSDEDVMAAFDDAISDGVDLISVSLGGIFAHDFTIDTIAIGAFHAMTKGILTMQSAGNSGPLLSTVTSVAPWVFSVAASTIDRQFLDKVILGDGTTLVGTVVNGFDSMVAKFPLIYAGDAASSSCNSLLAGQCTDGCLDSTLVKGKIVFCDTHFRQEKEPFVKNAAGAILRQNTLWPDISSVYPLPGSALSSTDVDKLTSYLNSSKTPEASILKSESLKDSNAPVTASFSSRGPNIIASKILKPDVTAPGVDILAAWSPLAPPSESEQDARSVTYNIISGTSMACPHVTGASAYVKSFHPDWSPSAIKSALMTTAFPLDAKKNPDGEFGYGAGHIDPVKAVNPGLVYESLEEDYIRMLCGMYSPQKVGVIVGKSNSCPKDSKELTMDLNYPTMAFNTIDAKFTRTVTNVGVASSTYTATITSPPDMEVTVNPNVLSFKSLKEKQSFSITISSKNLPGKIASASLVWSDGIHKVRSPIVLYSSTISEER